MGWDHRWCFSGCWLVGWGIGRTVWYWYGGRLISIPLASFFLLASATACRSNQRGGGCDIQQATISRRDDTHETIPSHFCPSSFLFRFSLHTPFLTPPTRTQIQPRRLVKQTCTITSTFSASFYFMFLVILYFSFFSICFSIPSILFSIFLCFLCFSVSYILLLFINPSSHPCNSNEREMKRKKKE